MASRVPESYYFGRWAASLSVVIASSAVAPAETAMAVRLVLAWVGLCSLGGADGKNIPTVAVSL